MQTQNPENVTGRTKFYASPVVNTDFDKGREERKKAQAYNLARLEGSS
jgi:hypothetical protein